MYLDQVRRRIEERGFPDAEDIHPCTPAEVEALESRLGRALPGALREFLLWCGHGLGELWSGNRCFEYEELIQGRGLEAAREVLAREGHDASLLDGPVLVIQFDECDQFSFVRLDEGEDPPVYGRHEGAPVQQDCAHFSGLLKLIVDQEFGPETESVPGEDPGGSDPEMCAPLVRLGQAPDPGWIEVGCEFLPPSLRQQLGQLVASFRPSPANVFAAVVLGVLILGGGLVLLGLGFRELSSAHFQLPLFAPQGMSWAMLGLIAGGSVALMVCGGLLLRQAVRMSRSRVFMGENGLCRTRAGQYELVLWPEIREIEEIVMTESMPWERLLLRRWIPVGPSRHLVVHAARGGELRLTPSDLRSFARFESLLREAAASGQISWRVRRMET